MAPLNLQQDSEGLLVLTLENPPLNIYDQSMHEAFPNILDQIEAAQPRALLIKAGGRVTSAGVDVEIFESFSSTDEAEKFFAQVLDIGRRIQKLPCPTVFAVHGLCLTWAFEVALACDFIVASRSSSFGLIEASIGLTPAAGGIQRLAARIGVARARDVIMNAQRVSATDLAAIGGVDRVVDDGSSGEEARALALSLASGPTMAHAATKKIIDLVSEHGPEVADRETPGIAARLFTTSDLQNAVRSFLENGPGEVDFKGN